jgi:CheY-like chemotaxis protein
VTNSTQSSDDIKHAKAPKNTSNTTKDQPAIQNGETCRILIVDDEPVNRMVLKGYLTLKKTYSIIECSNGLDAMLSLSNDGPFDMVLLDVMMPGMSGYDVCREIRKTHSLLQLPVIFLTAKSRVEDLSEGYDSGANDFLYKPVVKEELFGKVNLHFKISKEFHNRCQQ